MGSVISVRCCKHCSFESKIRSATVVKVKKTDPRVEIIVFDSDLVIGLGTLLFAVKIHSGAIVKRKNEFLSFFLICF